MLGDKLDGLLVTDAYAAYNAIACERQSCLAHLLRKAREIAEELALIPLADIAAVRSCENIKTLFQETCKVKVPFSRKQQQTLIARLRAKLDAYCKAPLSFAKAETLRRRLLPDSTEYEQLFAFITRNGPPTNNHAERSLRPLVIFRKVCLGSRSPTGSHNIALFASLSQTASLQGSNILDVFQLLFSSSPHTAHLALFSSTDPPEN